MSRTMRVIALSGPIPWNTSRAASMFAGSSTSRAGKNCFFLHWLDGLPSAKKRRLTSSKGVPMPARPTQATTQVADVRQVLLEIYAAHELMNDLILTHLDQIGRASCRERV